ncbi:MAG: metallophosphoesterase [Acidobacteriota bacterium]
MRTRRIGCAAIVAALVIFILITRGIDPPKPNPPGTFSFAVLGDAPYYFWEEIRFRRVLKELNANDLAWAIHVGDIFWRPCTDDHYRKALARFNSLRHPVIYTPGDNETYDCWEAGSGGYAPQERVRRVREIFFTGNAARMPVVAQRVEFVENARWMHGGVVFATAHVIGSRNGMNPFPARTPADDAASRRRSVAAAAWVREAFAEARKTNAPAVVLAFHANPAFEKPAIDDYRRAYEPFIAAIESEAAAFVRPVLLLNGDDHEYLVDHPLSCCANVTRMQVPGSPLVGWVRVVVRPGAANPFAFEEYVVPQWKYW